MNGGVGEDGDWSRVRKRGEEWEDGGKWDEEGRGKRGGARPARRSVCNEQQADSNGVQLKRQR